MSLRQIEATIAETFVKICTIRRVNSDINPISSKELMQQCASWCATSSLPCPNYQELTAAMTARHYTRHKSHGQRLWTGVAWNPNPDPITEMIDTGTMRRLLRKAPVIPLRVFISLVGMAKSTFYALSGRGQGPKAYRKGRRVLILATDAVEWCAATGRNGAVISIADWVERHFEAIDRVRLSGVRSPLRW